MTKYNSIDTYLCSPFGHTAEIVTFFVHPQLIEILPYPFSPPPLSAAFFRLRLINFQEKIIRMSCVRIEDVVGKPNAIITYFPRPCYLSKPFAIFCPFLPCYHQCPARKNTQDKLLTGVGSAA